MTWTGDADLPDVADDELSEAIQRTKPYTIVVLRAGPHYAAPGPDRPSDVDSIIWAHGKRNYALRKAGLMPIVFPIADGSSIVGISVFKSDPDEVQRIMAGDPAVENGIFTYEVHPTRSFAGSVLPE
jgi:hypothetical protein